MPDEVYVKIPNRFNSKCFACSSNNPAGLQMTFMAGKDSVISEVKIPIHLSGWSNLVHGGILTTILDEIMSWSAMHFMKCLVMTKNMNITFNKSVAVGETVKAIGKIIKQQNRHELLMEGTLVDQSGTPCVRAEAVFAMLSPKLASRMGFADEDIPEEYKG